MMHFRSNWKPRLNKAQRGALYRLWLRSSNGMTYPQFRRTVYHSFGVVMVPWCGMVVGIEPDGHTHS